MTTIFLKAGACFTSEGSFDKCALQPIECQSSESFRSAAWLDSNNIEVAEQCSRQETLRQLQSMGRCNSSADRFICTSDKTACRFSSVFEAFATDCNLVVDFYASNEFTNSHYGYCEDRIGKNDFCAWNFKDCVDPDLWEWNIADPFFANQNPDCHCDKVKTGACVNESTEDRFCAVMDEACGDDDGYTFYRVLELENKYGVICKLCDTIPPELFLGATLEDEGYGEFLVEDSEKTQTEASSENLEGVDSENTQTEASSENQEGVDSEKTQTEASSENLEGVPREYSIKTKSTSGDDDDISDNTNLSNGAIAGITIGSVAFVGLAILGLIHAKGKNRSEKDEVDPDDTRSVGTLQSIQ